MPIVRFPPRFKRSLKLARNKVAALQGQSLARAIARLEAPHRDLVETIVARLDPAPDQAPDQAPDAPPHPEPVEGSDPDA